MTSDYHDDDLPQRPSAGSKERFFRYFQHEITALQVQMDRLPDTPAAGGERSDAIDHCMAGIARLQHEVKDAASYVPAYDQKTYADAIKALTEKLTTTRAALAPRPKFSFRNAPRKNPSAISVSDAAELATQSRHTLRPAAPTAPARPTNGDSAPGSGISVSDREGAHIAPASPRTDTAPPAPAAVSHVQRCVVDLSSLPPLASLTLTTTTSSLVVAPPVLGAVHATSLADAVLVLPSCGQLRMHECRGVDVYASCASRVVIEGCRGVRFAPHVGLAADGESSESGAPQVDDFDHPGGRSPNWAVIPPEERVGGEVWAKIAVPGEAVVQRREGRGKKIQEEQEGVNGGESTKYSPPWAFCPKGRE